MSNSFATTWNLAHQAPLSLEFSRQEYWSGLPFPSPEDLPDPGIKPTSPAQAGSFFTTEPPGKPRPSVLGPNSPSYVLPIGWRFQTRIARWNDQGLTITAQFPHSKTKRILQEKQVTVLARPLSGAVVPRLCSGGEAGHKSRDIHSSS